MPDEVQTDNANTVPVADSQQVDNGVLGGEPSATAADESWVSSLPEGMREDATFAKFKDVAGLANSYKSLESKLGANPIVKPKEALNENNKDQWDAYYSALGRPASADKYEISPTENAELISEDLVNNFKETAHTLGLTNEQASEVVNFQLAAVVEAQKEQQLAMQKGVDSLKAELGNSFGEFVSVAKEAYQNFLGDEGVKSFASELGVDPLFIKNSPTFIKLFNKLGMSISEDSIQTTGTASSINSRAALEDRKNEIMLDKNHPDYKLYHDEKNLRNPMRKRLVEELNSINQQLYLNK
jgi:hypothetical protein